MFEAGLIFCAEIPFQDNAGQKMTDLSTEWSSPDWTNVVDLVSKTSARDEWSFIVLCLSNHTECRKYWMQWKKTCL